MSEWATIDALKSRESRALDLRGAARTKGKATLCTFAKTADGRFRFRARSDERRIKVEVMPPGFRFQWRSWGYYALDVWLRSVIQYDARTISAGELEAVMVARDAWLEMGGRPMTRPFALDTKRPASE